VSFALPLTSTPSRAPADPSANPAVRRSTPLRLAALRAPLAVKVVGANLVVIAMFLAAWLVSGHRMTAAAGLLVVAGVVLHLALILVALRPIRDLDAVASRVWKGDYAARVSRSAVADQDTLRVGSMFNILLDSLADERTRIRTLASEIITAGEAERSALARELHDSTAQRLAGLLLQLSAAVRDCKDPALIPRLVAARDAAQEITEEVRMLSETIRPIVLDELGLVPALEKLARDSTRGTGIDVDVDVDSVPRSISPNIASALYRVAQEAVRNAVLHASAHRIRIVLHADARSARLEVMDDGIGFDPVLIAGSEGALKGGLSSMRERVALVDGGLEIKSAPRGGTTIVATIPLTPAA
jgi:signal transduction histidine kinase